MQSSPKRTPDFGAGDHFASQAITIARLVNRPISDRLR